MRRRRGVVCTSINAAHARMQTVALQDSQHKVLLAHVGGCRVGDVKNKLNNAIARTLKMKLCGKPGKCVQPAKWIDNACVSAMTAVVGCRQIQWLHVAACCLSQFMWRSHAPVCPGRMRSTMCAIAPPRMRMSACAAAPCYMHHRCPHSHMHRQNLACSYALHHRPPACTLTSHRAFHTPRAFGMPCG
jgi:hypothetical protein